MGDGGGVICPQRGEEIIQRLVHKTQLRIPSSEIRKAARLAPGGATGKWKQLFLAQMPDI